MGEKSSQITKKPQGSSMTTITGPERGIFREQSSNGAYVVPEML